MEILPRSLSSESLKYSKDEFEKLNPKRIKTNQSSKFLEDEFKFENSGESEEQSESEFEQLDKYSSDWKQYEKL